MKIKFQLNNKKNILLAVYVIFIITNLIASFYIFNFINTNIYKIQIIESRDLLSPLDLKSIDINIEKFNEVKNNIADKSKADSLKINKDIFN